MKLKVTGLPRYSAIVADEAIKSLYKLHWQNKMQQFINILYAICRQENKLSILCIPRFSDLNEFFRQHRVKFWIHIIDEISRNKDVGHAVIFTKSWNPFTLDAWNFKDTLKEIDNYARIKHIKEVEFNINSKAYVLSKSRNYVGMLEFGLMPNELFDKYMELKRKYAYDDLGDTTNVSKNRREILWIKRTQKLATMLLEQGKTHTEIGEALGVTQARVAQILSEKT